MKSFFIRHWPQHKSTWKKYLKVFLPIIAGSTLFALNGVIDNFMVGHVVQGQAALGAVNSWTNILMGWFAGTAAGGSVVLAQFYHAKKYKTASEIANYRYILCFIMALTFAIIAWTDPDLFINVFVHKPTVKYDKDSLDWNAYKNIMDAAHSYIKVIAIQWILISFSFNYGNQLRELGYGKVSMFWGMGTLATNIVLNSIFMYVVGMGVEGAAWASVASRIVAITTGVIFIHVKKLPIGFKPLTCWRVSRHTQVLFWKRWIYFMSIFTVTFFITFRTYFYTNAYPLGGSNGHYLGVGLTGLAIISLTGALMNVFTTTFNALTAMSANFVGSNLGKGNLKQAKYESDKLKGFNTTVSATFSILIICFAFCVPHMGFLAKTKHDKVTGALTFDGAMQLRQVSHSLMVVAGFYPLWIWFSTSYRNGMAGGKGGWFSFVDWIISGPLQLGWLAILVIVVHSNGYISENFWVVYIMFYTSDLLKLFFQEILYYRYNWLHSLTKEEVNEEKTLANDYVPELKKG